MLPWEIKSVFYRDLQGKKHLLRYKACSIYINIETWKVYWYECSLIFIYETNVLLLSCVLLTFISWLFIRFTYDTQFLTTPLSSSTTIWAHLHVQKITNRRILENAKYGVWIVLLIKQDCKRKHALYDLRNLQPLTLPKYYLLINSWETRSRAGLYRREKNK